MDTNRDLQAIHHILHLFESSNSCGQDILDTVSGLFCIIDEMGTIFRGNNNLAEFIGSDREQLLGKFLQALFSTEQWTYFSSRIETLLGAATSSGIEFELDLGTNHPRNFIWSISPLKLIHHPEMSLFTVMGRDVTELHRVIGQKARMESELATAKAIQETLLPAADVDLGVVKISGSYQSASECGGDLWFYTKVDEQLYICIGDVTGHGVQAALLSSAVRAIFGVKNLLLENSPSEVLALLNDVICEMTKMQSLMTVIIGQLDLKTGELVYAAAGHEPLVIIPGDIEINSVKSFQMCSIGSRLLGLEPNVTFDEQRAVLKSGDRLFLYTDGLYEALSPKDPSGGQRKLFRRLMVALKDAQEPRDVVRALRRDIDVILQDFELQDDVTFFVLQMT